MLVNEKIKKKKTNLIFVLSMCIMYFCIRIIKVLQLNRFELYIFGINNLSIDSFQCYHTCEIKTSKNLRRYFKTHS